MFRLQTLGGLALSDPAGVPMALQRRRLALLALLAAAGEAGLRRDKLVARLWSESSGENARHGLEQLLYSLRRQFPPHGPFSGIDPVRLDSGVVESDIQEFESALRRGALSEAVTLYRGPFLDGFYLADEGFEEWVEGERQRLAGRYSETLHLLAKEAGAERRHTEAIAWWSRLASLDPLSERPALGLAHALADAGDAASALRQAQAYAERARAELGVPPTPEHAAFMQRMRTAETIAPASPEPRQALSERYRIERELGRGTVATVYLARDLRHNRLVALKVLRPELIDTTEARRFLREISIAASLYHPHIIQLYDSGVTDGAAGACSPYYVMPHIQGESLRERIIRDVQLPVEVATAIALSVADGLAYAHDRGIVHRDIKPENILLEGDHALVADFGIAHALESGAGEKLSQSGVVLGTPAYMSPEQGRGGEAVDARSDVYSLGCVLYEMLAGEPPFTGRTTQAILARHAADPVRPIRTVCPGVSEALERTIGLALEKSPARRFQSAALLAKALRDLQA
jgi:DNA-binding SARP family transcriptional activator